MDMMLYGILFGFGSVIGAVFALALLIVLGGGVGGYRYRKRGPGG